MDGEGKIIITGERVEVQEFIDFANAIVPDSTENISDLKSGEVWCELLNLMEEDTVKADKINKGKDLSEKECKKNYKALKKALAKKDVEYLPALDDNIDDIVNGNEKANYEVAKWFKQWVDENAEISVVEKINNDIEEATQNRDEDFKPAEITLPAEGDDADATEATVEEEPVEDAEPSNEADGGEAEVAAEAGDTDAIEEEHKSEEQIAEPTEAGEEAATGDDEVPTDEDAKIEEQTPEEGFPEEIDEPPTDTVEEIPDYPRGDYGADEETPEFSDPMPGEEKIADDHPSEAPADEAEVNLPEENPHEAQEEEQIKEPIEAMEESIQSEEIASSGLDDDSLKTIKKVALVATCGALFVMAFGCGCYYRSRCGKQAGTSKSGGFFARIKAAFTKPQGASAKVTADIPHGGASAKITSGSEHLALGRGMEDMEVPEKIIEMLWDWFQNDPSKKATVIMEKKM